MNPYPEQVGANSFQRILLTGGSGQLGHECQLAVPPGVELAAPDLDVLDLADPTSIRNCVRDVSPAVILHCGAWTAVDAAEEQVDAAFAVNATGSRILAEEAASLGARVILISTDYVFSGAGDRPWLPDDPIEPINAYGRSKAEAEAAVSEILGSQAQIVRTSWVYGRRGHNFVRTMLRLMEEGRALSVINDQLGAPTWAGGLARALWALTRAPETGPILHYSDVGITSWFGFAAAIREVALGLGLEVADSSVSPCSTEDYPTPAPRPAWSPLALSPAWEQLGVAPEPWDRTLEQALSLLVAEDARAS